MDTWRTWELVLPRLERDYEVVAPTLPGHAGGPPLPVPASADVMVEFAERALGERGWERAHVAGNSLGGFVALQLAARGRAESVVAFAPAGGWADTRRRAELLAFQREFHANARSAAAGIDVLLATDAGRRAATALLTTNYRHMPGELIAHLTLGVARCSGAAELLDLAETADWDLDVARIDCPLRIVWGTADKLLPWAQAAERLRHALPHADWVELDGVGHAPQLDVPLEAAELIAGFGG